MSSLKYDSDGFLVGKGGKTALDVITDNTEKTLKLLNKKQTGGKPAVKQVVKPTVNRAANGRFAAKTDDFQKRSLAAARVSDKESKKQTKILKNIENAQKGSKRFGFLGAGAGVGSLLSSLLSRGKGGSGVLKALAAAGLGGAALKGISGGDIKPDKPSLLGKLKGAGKGFKLGGAIGAAMMALNIADVELSNASRGEKNKAHAKNAAVGLGGIGGAAAGGMAGAAMGSVVPVVGTAIGGIVGMLLGGFGGSKLMDKMTEAVDKRVPSNTSERFFSSWDGATSVIQESGKNFWDNKIPNMFKPVLKGIELAMKNVFAPAQAAWSAVTQAPSAVSSAWSKAKDMVSDAWTGLVGGGGRERLVKSGNMKGGQAIAGGRAHEATYHSAMDFGEKILGSDFKQVTAVNDAWHRKNRQNSKHTQGLAWDLTTKSGSKEAAYNQSLKMYEAMVAAGLNGRFVSRKNGKDVSIRSGSDFMILDEYNKPSKGSTGGHIHGQFNSKAAADKYMAYRNSMLKQGGTSDAMALNLIRREEQFEARAKWDVNAYRAGYGSDTYTDKNGNVHKVKQGTVVSKEDAERDLQRRMSQFKNGVRNNVGAGVFDKLNPATQAALTSLAYNTGSISNRNFPNLMSAIKTGDDLKIASAIENVNSTTSPKYVNGLAARRNNEADMIRAAVKSVKPQSITPQEVKAGGKAAGSAIGTEIGRHVQNKTIAHITSGGMSMK